MMKRNLFLLCALFVCTMGFSQNTEKSADDAERIAISAYVDPSSAMPQKAQKVLGDRIQKIITKNGMGAMRNQRFIMTANVRELGVEKTNTAPIMYIFELEVNLYIGDGIDGTLFASTSIETKGLDESREKAYLDAIKKIKASDPAYQSFIAEGKKRILEYYNSKCSFIIQEAQTIAEKQEYDAAISKLMSVPDVCKDCYDRCMTAVRPIYQARIDKEGAELLAAAKAAWASGQDASSAEAAGAILSQINPSSSSFSGAEQLTAEMAARIKELDQREWNFMLKQQQDAVDLEKAQIQAIRDIGVAYGEHQQPVTYNIGWY